MKRVTVIFPHQLFLDSPVAGSGDSVYLVEEDLFFLQYPYHKSKLAFHRASMKYYQHYLAKAGAEVHYVESGEEGSDIRDLVKLLSGKGVREIRIADPVDDWLEKRLNRTAEGSSLEIRMTESPSFINSRTEMESYLEGDRSPLQTSFYMAQRKKHHILLESDGRPHGGQWTFDRMNRKKYPRNHTPPRIHWPAASDFLREAVAYVESKFADHTGEVDMDKFYPHTHRDAERWLDAFLSQRFQDFGTYQDAMVSGHSYLHHSVISPMLNAGLLTPRQVIDRAIEHSHEEEIPLNALEGFIRQILGWREFIRGIYQVHGVRQRTGNFWGHRTRIPESFWTGNTGILPVDEVIGKVLRTGYAHHIERLMVLGNFMLLCGFDPDEVYRWFMALFVDAYDWVMVPNVYGMSQFSDGGLLATKPYISGSNYLMKMGNYPKGEWQTIWDGLYWGFISKHSDFFRGNPRLSLMVKQLERMDDQRRRSIFQAADSFLTKLHSR